MEGIEGDAGRVCNGPVPGEGGSVVFWPLRIQLDGCLCPGSNSPQRRLLQGEDVVFRKAFIFTAVVNQRSLVNAGQASLVKS